MKREIITISTNGAITVPKNDIRMTVSEIADLFGIYYQTAKQGIRSIEKLGVIEGDYLMSCTIQGRKIVPEYYGLEMITALSFRIQSRNAEVFRKWLLKKALRTDIPEMLIISIQNPILN